MNDLNIEFLNTAIRNLQNQQHLHLSLDALVFTLPFEGDKELDIEILNINLFEDTEKAVFYWQILCCGSDSRLYAEELSRDTDCTVFCHDLEGTRNGMELFSITLIAD